MSSILLVPIHLDALYVDAARPVVEARADFSRLPYFDGTRDVNPDTAYISEVIVAHPFQNLNLVLKAGIHLHWSLPDALTKGVHNDSGMTFPAVPNRWLITRLADDGGGGYSVERRWVVESDYLFPEGAGYESGAISYPVTPDPAAGKYQPFRYMGRKVPFDAWQALDPNAEYLTPPLTAVGYGNPAFAALYPDCHSVFGLYDDGVSGVNPNGKQYEVVGWYADAALDPLTVFIQDFSGVYQNEHGGASPSQAEIMTAVKEEFAWTAEIGGGEDTPEQILCYARLTFDTPAGVTENDAVSSDATTVTAAASATEALAARLAAQVDNKYKTTIEDQLEALALSDGLDHRAVDVGAKFLEARHEKGFRAVPGGSLWTIVIARNSATPADAAAGGSEAQLALPDDIAQQLNALNVVQAQYDRALFAIAARRRQIFADWYKYMICAYPPVDARDSYPDIDETRNFILLKDIAPLQDEIDCAGALALQVDTDGVVTGASAPGSAADALATALASAITALVDALTVYNAGPQAQAADATFALRQTAAPRYWQPNEPEVLLEGPAVEPTLRHGHDDRLSEDGTLECHLLANQTVQALIPGNLIAVRQRIDQIEAIVSADHFGFATWNNQPWNPISLEWQVEVFPTRKQSNLQTAERNYMSDFITANYTLPINAPELRFVAGVGAVIKGANVYSGSSILTPHAQHLLQARLQAYLQKFVVGDYYVDQNVPAHERTAEYLGQHIDAITSWYETQNNYAVAGDDVKAGDPVYTALRAYSRLADLPALSQVLGGFNDALLQFRTTMQLEVADPLAFDDYRAFSETTVRVAVGSGTTSAPEPLNDFNPIRSGAMKIIALRLVDTFGRIKDLDVGKVGASEAMTIPARDDLLLLPPRLTQPARLNFRWLAAQHDELEMNAHPASSPICGWVLPNNLDQSLMIYDAAGQPLGSLTLNPETPWQPPPGSDASIAIGEIENAHLSRMTQFIADQGQDFIQALLSTIDSALETIDPENAQQHLDRALLMGRPLALVRAALDLELRDPPAIHQGWNTFRQDMQRHSRQTDAFTRVQFPVRIGEYGQFNDGLVGYWKETDAGYEDNTFYAPQSNVGSHANIVAHSNAPLNVLQSVDARPHVFAMLLDPRGVVHATSGITPTKAIGIPPDQYVKALQAINITFLTAPLLSAADKVRLPLPVDSGYDWSWLARGNANGWSAISTKGIVRQQAFSAVLQNATDVWDELLAQGWLTAIDATTASVTPGDQRGSQTLAAQFESDLATIEQVLESASIGSVSPIAAFDGAQIIREGWLMVNATVHE